MSGGATSDSHPPPVLRGIEPHPAVQHPTQQYSTPPGSTTAHLAVQQRVQHDAGAPDVHFLRFADGVGVGSSEEVPAPDAHLGSSDYRVP